MIGSIYETTDESFYEDMEGIKWVIVDFYKDPCPPCSALYPHLLELEDEDRRFEPSLMKMDYEKSESIVMDLKVRAAPTLKLFKDGKPYATMYGAGATAESIKEWFREVTE